METILTDKEWAALSPESRHKINAYFLADASRQKEIQTLGVVMDEQLQKIIRLNASNQRLTKIVSDSAGVMERVANLLDYIEHSVTGNNTANVILQINEIRPLLRNLAEIIRAIVKSESMMPAMSKDTAKSERTWRSMDSAPKDGTQILVWDRASLVVKIAFWERTAKYSRAFAWVTEYDEDGFALTANPLSWMPLPEPPAKEVE